MAKPTHRAALKAPLPASSDDLENSEVMDLVDHWLGIKIRINRAEYFEDEAEEYSTPTGIHPLDVRWVGVTTGARDDAVTVTLNRQPHDPYGVEFDLAPESARRLAEKLSAAAASKDAGEADRDF
jgi:hypothetical protein